MAAPSYTTNLTQVTDAESTTNWNALGGGAAGLSVEPDFTIQGSNCIAKQIKAETKGHMFASAVSSSASTNHAFIWVYVSTPGTTDTVGLGGIRITIGSDTTNRKEFYVAGNDTYAKGGWVNYPIRYELEPDASIGSPPATSADDYGAVMKGTVTVKAPNLGIDIIYIGHSVSITVGDSGDPGTLSALAFHAENTTRAWGLIQEISGGVLLQGTCNIGVSGTAAYYSEQNILVLFPNNNREGLTRHTNTDFKAILIDNASTTAIFFNMSFLSLDTSDRGLIDVINTTNNIFDTCSFQNLGNITLHANSTLRNSTIQNSDTLFPNTAIVQNNLFVKPLLHIGLTYSGNSKSVSAESTGSSDIKFSNDGLSFFLGSISGSAIYQYDLTVAYDLSSTVTYSGNSLSTTGEDNDPTAFDFNADGTKIFVIGRVSDTIYEYTISTGFDFSSTLTYTGNSFSLSSQDGNMRGLKFNTAGTTFLTVGLDNTSLFEYSVSTGFDLSSTVAYTSRSSGIGNEETLPLGLTFKNSGFTGFVSGTNTDSVHEYNMPAGIALTSKPVHSGGVNSFTGQDSNVAGIVIEGQRLFMVGDANNTVYEYAIYEACISTANLTDISLNKFTAGSHGHAVRLTSVSPSPMLWENTQTGYAGADGDTGNEVVFVDVATGSLTINVTPGSTTPTVRTRGATVTVQNAPVTLKIIVSDPDGALITDLSVNVLVEAAAGGPLSVGTDIIKAFTDVNGEVADVSSYASDQPFTGWVRKSSVTPFYKQSDISGTISKDNGLTLNVQMVSDE